MDIQPENYTTLDEFWPAYVRQHAAPANRRMHFVGNTNLIAWLVLAALRRSAALVVVAVISSYALAWIGHFYFERNTPATLRYPVLSALADLRMYLLTWRGEMDAEVARYVKS